MSKEENKKAYDALDHPGLTKKMGRVMTHITVGNADSADKVFGLVKDTFTLDELAFFTAVFAAEKTHEKIQSSDVLKFMGGLARDLGQDIANTEMINKILDDQDKEDKQ